MKELGIRCLGLLGLNASATDRAIIEAVMMMMKCLHGIQSIRYDLGDNV